MRNPFDRSAFGQAPDPAAYLIGRPQAGAGAPDERVRQALDAINCGYEIDKSSRYHIIIRYPAEGRTQLVLVASQTTIYREREWRKVWSNAFQVTGRLSGDQALMLLSDSDKYPLGAWCIEESDGKTTVFFQISLPADAVPTELDNAMLLAAEAADDMEKNMVGTDDY